MRRYIKQAGRFKTQLSKGGVAPIDIWASGEDWDDGVFKEMRSAMAYDSLHIDWIRTKADDRMQPPPRPAEGGLNLV